MALTASATSSSVVSLAVVWFPVQDTENVITIAKKATNNVFFIDVFVKFKERILNNSLAYYQKTNDDFCYNFFCPCKDKRKIC